MHEAKIVPPKAAMATSRVVTRPMRSPEVTGMKAGTLSRAPLQPKQTRHSLRKRRRNRRSCAASQLNTPALARPSLIRSTSSCRLKGCRRMCSANV